jgi:hypothetical protein
MVAGNAQGVLFLRVRDPDDGIKLLIPGGGRHHRGAKDGLDVRFLNGLFREHANGFALIELPQSFVHCLFPFRIHFLSVIKQRGAQFQPELVDVLVEHWDEIYSLYRRNSD